MENEWDSQWVHLLELLKECWKVCLKGRSQGTWKVFWMWNSEDESLECWQVLHEVNSQECSLGDCWGDWQEIWMVNPQVHQMEIL